MDLFIRSTFGSKINYLKLQENLTIAKTIMRQNSNRIVLSSDPGATVLINSVDVNMPFATSKMTELYIYYNDASNNTISSPWKPTMNDIITNGLLLSDPNNLATDKTFKNLAVSFINYLLQVKNSTLIIDNIYIAIRAFLEIINQRLYMEKLLKTSI